MGRSASRDGKGGPPAHRDGYHSERRRLRGAPPHRRAPGPSRALRPVSLLRVLESNFPGDPLSKLTDMRIPTP